jgi:hypothetical protein
MLKKRKTLDTRIEGKDLPLRPGFAERGGIPYLIGYLM